MELLSRSSNVGTGRESARRLPAVVQGETYARPAMTVTRPLAYAAPGGSDEAARYGYVARGPWPAAQPSAVRGQDCYGARCDRYRFQWQDQISSAVPARRESGHGERSLPSSRDRNA